MRQAEGRVGGGESDQKVGMNEGSDAERTSKGFVSGITSVEPSRHETLWSNKQH